MRVCVKELTGIELGALPGLIANGYAVYISAVNDGQGWRVRDVKAAENSCGGRQCHLVR